MYSVKIARDPVTYFPDAIAENADAHRAIKHFLKNRKGTLLQRLVRFVKQQLGS